MANLQGLIKPFKPFHPPNSLFPPEFNVSEPASLGVQVQVPQKDDAPAFIDLKEMMENDGKIYWDTLIPYTNTRWPRESLPSARYAESGHAFPDAFITTYNHGLWTHYPIHRFIFEAYFTKARRIHGFDRHNFLHPPTHLHFEILHEYIYLRDLGNILQFCVQAFIVPDDIIMHADQKNWDDVITLLPVRLSIDAMQAGARRIVEFWGLLYMLGFYDYDLCWTLNFCWWILMEALPGEYHRPMDTWMDEMYAAWSADKFPENPYAKYESTDGTFPSLTAIMYSLCVDVAGESPPRAMDSE